jgi:hypothetical protein
MTKDRQVIVLAVLEGILPVDAITENELNELHEAVFDAVVAKQMSRLPHLSAEMH